MAFNYGALDLRESIAPRALAEHMRLCQKRNRIRHDEADAQKQEAGHKGPTPGKWTRRGLTMRL